MQFNNNSDHFYSAASHPQGWWHRSLQHQQKMYHKNLKNNFLYKHNIAFLAYHTRVPPPPPPQRLPLPTHLFPEVINTLFNEYNNAFLSNHLVAHSPPPPLPPNLQISSQILTYDPVYIWRWGGGRGRRRRRGRLWLSNGNYIPLSLTIIHAVFVYSLLS